MSRLLSWFIFLFFLTASASAADVNYEKMRAPELKILAGKGDSLAQTNLGFLYHAGLGVAQDFKEAAAWYRKAAEQGQPDAQTNLGMLYNTGRGVAQDFKEAAAWYRKAAEQGDAHAQNNLGFLYSTGQGVVHDLVLAYAFLNLSATAGHDQSQKNREQLIKRMSARQLEEGQDLSRKWKLGMPLPTASKTGK